MSGETVLHLNLSDGPPVVDLARESWLIERAAGGEISLFLTSWRDPVVVLGYGQADTDVDLEWCRARGMPVLRRLTGGTGVVHQGDLGVGLALPQTHPWGQGIISLYGRFLDVLEPALRSVGAAVSRVAEPRRASRVRSPICFLDQLADTLVVDGRKAVGCAQTRRKGAVLIHAAVLLGLDAELYSRVFGIPVEDVVAGLTPAFPGGDPGVLGEAIAAHLADALGLEVVQQRRWTRYPRGFSSRTRLGGGRRFLFKGRSWGLAFLKRFPRVATFNIVGPGDSVEVNGRESNNIESGTLRRTRHVSHGFSGTSAACEHLDVHLRRGVGGKSEIRNPKSEIPPRNTLLPWCVAIERTA